MSKKYDITFALLNFTFFLLNLYFYLTLGMAFSLVVCLINLLFAGIHSQRVINFKVGKDDKKEDGTSIL